MHFPSVFSRVHSAQGQRWIVTLKFDFSRGVCYLLLQTLFQSRWPIGLKKSLAGLIFIAFIAWKQKMC